MTVISSRRNQYFKTARSLMAVNQRRKQRKFLAEGVHFVSEAFKAKVKIEFIFYTQKSEGNQSVLDIISEAEALGVTCLKIKEDLLMEVMETESPQGIVACVNFPNVEDYKPASQRESFFIMVDAIQDPGNLGTLIRLADAAGVDRIFLNKGTVDHFNSKVLRSTMGSIFHIPIQKVDFPVDVIKSFIDHNIKVYATSPHQGEYYYNCDFKGPIMFVIGSEGKGISEEVMAEIKEYTSIPILGQAESLNAAMATGIILYEVVRQRNT